MQLTITVRSSFVDPTTQQNSEAQGHTVTLNIPDHLYRPFILALRNFVREKKLGDISGLTVTIPHRLSWDPVLKIRGWTDLWKQEAHAE